jgi:CelD/BcsL family acetyltransferase involved in cellulose biosynthesis
MMNAYVVAREDAFDFRSTEYTALYDRSEATLFQHPTWLDQVYRHRAPATRSTRVVVTIRDEADARLVAVLPLVRRRRCGVRLVEFADLGVSDYAAPVIDRYAADRVLADPEVPRLVRAALGGFDLLHVQKLKGSATSTARLLGAPGVRRLPYDTHPVALPPATEDWREKLLDPSFARHLARKRKRLRPKGEYAVREVTDPDEVEAMLDRIRSFRAERFAERRAVDLMQDPDCFSFYSAVARQSAADGGPTRLSAIVVGGAPVAATLDLVDDGEHLFLIVGYDFGRLRNYSLGLLIVDDLIDRAVAAGLHTFDLTVGNEGYKSDFGATPVPMYAVRSPRTPLGRLAGWVMDLEALARRMVKRGLSARANALERWRARPQN